MGVGAGAGRGGAHPLTRVRLALHPRLPPNKHTRSRAPAQRCTHACHLISTPTHVQHMPAALMSACSGWAGLGSGFGEVGVGWGTPSTAHMPARWQAHPLTRNRWGGVLGRGGGVGVGGLGPGWGTCSRALAQHCIHASHLKSAPAHVHPPSTACMPAT